MASIVVKSGKQMGVFLALGHEAKLIGRDGGDHLQIKDGEVSRHHLKIEFDEDHQQYWAVDNKSENGVYVGDRKIIGRAALRDGDGILIGKTSLLFTHKDITDHQGARNIILNALSRPKMAGERNRSTLLNGRGRPK